MSEIESLKPRITQIRNGSFIVGAAALAITAAGAFLNPGQFFHSYLIAWLLLLEVTLGSAGLLMLHHLTSGYWGLIIRRISESALRTLPLVALLIVPLLLGISFLYKWTDAAAVAADPLLQSKEFYFNTPFFYIRQAIYFAIWFALAWNLLKWSTRQDEDPDLRALANLRTTSGPGLVLYALTITFAAVDWVMALEPHYFSTTFGFRLITGQAVNAAAFAVATAMIFSKTEPVALLINRKRLRDLGNILLTFIMVWAYIAFTEYLIVWAGNIPEETGWFIRRFHAGWGTLAWLLIAFHFFVPFFLLLQRSVKHRPMLLAMIAGLLLCMRWLELLWFVGPARHPTFSIHWMDLAASLGSGGIWFGLFLHQLLKRPLIPAYDPLLREPVDGESTVPV